MIKAPFVREFHFHHDPQDHAIFVLIEFLISHLYGQSHHNHKIVHHVLSFYHSIFLNLIYLEPSQSPKIGDQKSIAQNQGTNSLPPPLHYIRDSHSQPLP